MLIEERIMKVMTNQFNEDIQTFTTQSGLEVIILHRPGFKQSTALYGTPFGSLNLEQKLNGEHIEHKKGLAHFLEHKLFEVEDGTDVLSTFANMGASANAFTSYDETMYYFNHNGPIQEPLELLLDFVSEFKISQESVDKEKGIITEELIMYEQMPDMMLLTETFRNVFHDYPIIHDIAGTRESVAATTLEDLELAYKMNYSDERMVLVVVSPEEPQALKAIIEAKTANHPKSLDKVEDYFQTEAHEVVRDHRTLTAKVSQDKMSVAYKFAYDGDNSFLDEFKMKLILDMNFTEMNPEFQTYLDQQIISNTFSYDVDIQEDIGVIYFFNDSDRFDEFVKLIDDKMANLIIEEALFDQLSRRTYGEMIFSLSNTSRIGITVARYHLKGENYYDFIEAVRNLSYESLYQVANYFKDFSKTSLLLTNR